MAGQSRRSMADLLAAQRDTAQPPVETGAGVVAEVRDEPVQGVVVPDLPSPYQASSRARLDEGERADLAACEAALDVLRVAFAQAGKALQVIRDARLYRDTHPTFEAYAEERWQMSRAQAYRLIREWPLAEDLSPIGDKALNDGLVRELVPLEDLHGRDAAVTVYQTVTETDGVRVTASLLKGVVGVLPKDRFDPAGAVKEIRAFLAGNLPPAPDPTATAAQQWVAEAERIRSTLRRIRRDTIRAAAAHHPEEARQLVTELRTLADDVERGAKR